MHADVPAGAARNMYRGCGRDLMVIIWAGSLSWDLVRDVLWYEGRDFVGDSALEMPCPNGSI